MLIIVTEVQKQSIIIDNEGRGGTVGPPIWPLCNLTDLKSILCSSFGLLL